VDARLSAVTNVVTSESPTRDHFSKLQRTFIPTHPSSSRMTRNSLILDKKMLPVAEPQFDFNPAPSHPLLMPPTRPLSWAPSHRNPLP
jgi:hypothetical protein